METPQDLRRLPPKRISAVPFEVVHRQDLQFQAATTVEQLAALEPTWRALYAQTDLPPYYSFEWFRDAVSLTPEPKNVGFCICVVRDASGPAGIVPLQIVKGLLATFVTFLAAGQPVAQTALLTPRLRGRAVVRKACEWVRRNHCRWDYAVFHKVLGGSQLHQELSGMANSPELAGRVEEQPIDPNVHIVLPNSWEEYLPGLSARHRRNIYQQTRKVGKLGAVRFERHGLEEGSSGAGLERAIEDALAVCRRSWQGNVDWGRTICDENQVDFFRAVCRSCAAQGWLDLSLLYVDDKPVSFIYGMTRAPIANIATLAFDPKLKPLSPGVVHMARYVQDSIERGFTAIDFGHEFNSYKRRWSKVTQPLYDYVVYATPRWSRTRRRLQARWQGSVRNRVRRLLRRVGAPIGKR